MSTEIYEGPELYVTRYVGPANEGEDRQRWQFTTLTDGVAQLRFEEIEALHEALGNELETRYVLRARAARGG